MHININRWRNPKRFAEITDINCYSSRHICSNCPGSSPFAMNDLRNWSSLVNMMEIWLHTSAVNFWMWQLFPSITAVPWSSWNCPWAKPLLPNALIFSPLDEDAVSKTLCHHNLFLLVNCHIPGVFTAEISLDGGAKLEEPILKISTYTSSSELSQIEADSIARQLCSYWSGKHILPYLATLVKIRNV